MRILTWASITMTVAKASDFFKEKEKELDFLKNLLLIQKNQQKCWTSTGIMRVRFYSCFKNAHFFSCIHYALNKISMFITSKQGSSNMLHMLKGTQVQWKWI